MFTIGKIDVPKSEDSAVAEIDIHSPVGARNQQGHLTKIGVPKREDSAVAGIDIHSPVGARNQQGHLTKIDVPKKEDSAVAGIDIHSPVGSRNQQGHLTKIDVPKKEDSAVAENDIHSPVMSEAATGLNNVTASGSSQNVGTFRIKSQNIGEIINLINGINNELNNEWDNIVKNDVNVINNSWASKDAKSYVDKLLTEGNKIKDVVAALKLLSNTYQKVINESENVQQDVQNSINRI